ncbi:MAG TPA: zinc-binding dehydrogenase [Candidatus Solibacter sp.]|nr:zinc-binding dehydrogenase [Candidatus Solibacter sp.]
MGTPPAYRAANPARLFPHPQKHAEDARVPGGLTADAAPLMCAGVTTFNALRNSGAGPGDLVAVLGFGGLGHLGAQFAAKMGFRTVGLARGKDKEALARQLGAAHYIDTQSGDPSAELQKLGSESLSGHSYRGECDGRSSWRSRPQWQDADRRRCWSNSAISGCPSL